MKDIRILVLQRGWLSVGEYSCDGEHITLKNSSTIRKWGTTRGLGQIANDGPTKDTVLDFDGETIVHVLSVIKQIKCDPDKWKI